MHYAVGIIFTVISIVIIYSLSARSRAASKAEAAVLAVKIKANPQDYYVSQGGLIPDPAVVVSDPNTTDPTA